jgi:hypothetical protein
MTRRGRPAHAPWQRRVTRASGPDGPLLGAILTTVWWRAHEHGAGMTPSSRARRWKLNAPPWRAVGARAAPPAAHGGPGRGGGGGAFGGLRSTQKTSAAPGAACDSHRDAPSAPGAPAAAALARRGAPGVAGGAAARGKARPSAPSAGAGGAPGARPSLSRPDPGGHPAALGLSSRDRATLAATQGRGWAVAVSSPSLPEGARWADARASRGAVGCPCPSPQAAERARHAASQPGRAVSPVDDPRERSAPPGGPDRGAGWTGRPRPCRPPPGPGLPAARRRPYVVSACGDGPSHAAVRNAVRAAVRLARRQKQLVRWLAADAQRTRGMLPRSHPELVAALPRAKGQVRHRLRRLETQGLLRMTRTPGGKTESVSLTAAGRQRRPSNVREVMHKEEEYSKTPGGVQTIRRAVRRRSVQGASVRVPSPLSAQPHLANPGKSMRINEV